MPRVGLPSRGLGAAPYFTDVPASHPFYQYIQRAKELGISNGCSADPPQFCPEETVTRGQMAAFVVRALEGAGAPTGGAEPAPDDAGGIVILGQRINPWIAGGVGLVFLALIVRK